MLASSGQPESHTDAAALGEQVDGGGDHAFAARGAREQRVAIDCSLNAGAAQVARQHWRWLANFAKPLDRCGRNRRQVATSLAVTSLVLERTSELRSRSNQAIGRHRCLGAKTVESYVRSIFENLELQASPDDRGRVPAVLSNRRT
jgi:hypothetical protein